MLLLSGSLMGQGQKPDKQDSKAMRHKRIGLTEEQMTAKMVSELELDEKQQKKVAASWSPNIWYTMIIGNETFSFMTPSSGGSGLVVSGSTQPTLLSSASVSGGTSYFGGLSTSGGTVSGGSSVSLSSYTGGGGFSPGGGGPGGGWH